MKKLNSDYLLMKFYSCNAYPSDEFSSNMFSITGNLGIREVKAQRSATLKVLILGQKVGF